MIQILILVVAVAILLLMIWQVLRVNQLDKNTDVIQQAILQQLEEKHRAMLLDFNDGLNKLGDRLSTSSNETSERLRSSVAAELQATRDAMQALQLAQNNSLSLTRETVLEKLHTTLSEQGKSQQVLINDTMLKATTTLTQSIESLTKAVDGRLEQIGGKVSERLDEGFKKTNQTFVDVMARLATIDEAQKKIDGLTTNVVSLQELLGDKRSRGAFGEVQLEALVRNVLPVNSFAMQYTFENGTRADCALFLPDPTGTVAVDSKFPLENYHRMFDSKLSDIEQLAAEKQFKSDVRKHVDDIANKYIISNVTSDGAVMFIPAEAVFAELHAYHNDVIEYAMNKRVWVVSPTTLMAVLNTARAVLKDVETRKQVHVIKEELGKLSKDFGRFDQRMKKLADNIRQAHENAQEVHISSQKISNRFAQIERVELANKPLDVLDIIDDKEDEV
ncbi:DNA recombination protein RmuC [Methylotenera sp.]|uniref:DNA recombination protein RmuC n=1 Tax=Methylotenera sp. TaxID=2051956 RepID=UPI00248716CF|nr:DNA recombination protein RmuC [Methylotenera sp.]MDI1361589.1 DNA recombination protein RmuC [Methylotenera sp.]